MANIFDQPWDPWTEPTYDDLEQSVKRHIKRNEELSQTNDSLHKLMDVVIDEGAELKDTIRILDSKLAAWKNTNTILNRTADELKAKQEALLNENAELRHSIKQFREERDQFMTQIVDLKIRLGHTQENAKNSHGDAINQLQARIQLIQEKKALQQQVSDYYGLITQLDIAVKTIESLEQEVALRTNEANFTADQARFAVGALYASNAKHDRTLKDLDTTLKQQVSDYYGLITELDNALQVADQLLKNMHDDYAFNRLKAELKRANEIKDMHFDKLNQVVKERDQLADRCKLFDQIVKERDQFADRCKKLDDEVSHLVIDRDLNAAINLKNLETASPEVASADIAPIRVSAKAEVRKRGGRNRN